MTGTTDWAPFMRSLRNGGYEGPLMLEVEMSGEPNLEVRLARCRESLEKLMTYAK